MMTRFFLLFVFVLLLNSTKAESSVNRIDSLKQVAHSDQPDTTRLRAYIDLVYLMESQDPEQAISWANEGLKLTQPSARPDLLAELYTNLAFVYVVQEDHQGAIPPMEQAATLWEQAQNRTRQARSLINLGIFHRKTGDYSRALSYQLDGLRIYEDLQDTAHVISALVNTTTVYAFQGMLDQAETNANRAYELSLAFGNDALIADACNSLGVYYLERELPQKAAPYFEKALSKYKASNDYFHVAKTSTNLGQVYRTLGKLDKAESHMLESLRIFQAAATPVEAATVNLNLSRIYHSQARYELAINTAEEAAKIFREYHAPTELKVAYLHLSESQEAAGKLEPALRNFQSYAALKDSLLNVEIAHQINELNTAYETERKEQEILVLTQENEIKSKQQLFLLSVFGLLAVAAGGFFMNYRQKQKHKADVARTKLAQHSKEIDILRAKIEEGTTQYSKPEEFSVTPEEINHYLHDPLTERELEVLYLLTDGLTNKAIGERLFVSVNTVKFHLQKIYVKLEVSNRTQAVKEVTRLRQKSE